MYIQIPCPCLQKVPRYMPKRQPTQRDRQILSESTQIRVYSAAQKYTGGTRTNPHPHAESTRFIKNTSNGQPNYTGQIGKVHGIRHTCMQKAHKPKYTLPRAAKVHGSHGNRSPATARTSKYTPRMRAACAPKPIHICIPKAHASKYTPTRTAKVHGVKVHAHTDSQSTRKDS